MQSAARTTTQQVRHQHIFRFAVLGLITALLAFFFVQAATPAHAANSVDMVTNVTIEEETSPNWGEVKVLFDYTIPNGSGAGDTFSITFPNDLFPHSASFTMLDPLGDPIAHAVRSGQTVTFTLTSWAESHQNMGGSGYIRAQVRLTDETIADADFTFTTNVPGKEFTDDVAITKVTIDRNGPAKSGGWTDYTDQGLQVPTNAIAWSVASAKGLPNGATTRVTITDDVSLNNQSIDCATLEVFRSFVHPTSGQLGPLDLADTSRYTLQCDENTFTLDLPAGLDEDELVWVNFKTSILDVSLPTYPNTALVSVNGAAAWPASAMVERSGDSGGTGTGTGLGSLTVTKLVTGDAASKLAEDTKFEIRIDCTLNGNPLAGFPKTHGLGKNETITQAAPVGALCSVTETDTKGASKVEITVNNVAGSSVTVANTPTSIVVTNTFSESPTVPPVKPVDPETTTPPTTLAKTGSAPATPVMLGAGLALMLGLGALAAASLRRRTR